MKIKHTYTAITSLAAALLSAAAVPATADVVTDWNVITLQATKTAGLNSILGSRIDAIEAIAVYDAVNSIHQVGTPYHYSVPSAGPASVDAAAAQAAHDVLVNYFPAQQAALDAKLALTLSLIPNGVAEDNGRAVGTAAAADIIALRANDGASPNLNYAGPLLPGLSEWRPTPSAFAPGINQQWGSVTPFVLPTSDLFRPEPPPGLNTGKYLKALAEVQAIGSVSNNLRTVDQTHIAQFYKQDAELTVNDAARQLVNKYNLSTGESALVLALVDIAVADARITVWEAKYTYNFWRAVTALNANADGSVTNGYSQWSPLIVTPAHPSYPSGHSGTVNGGIEILQSFFGDKQTLTLSTTTAGEPQRTVQRLSQIEEENGLSRIYGGIHFSFDNKEGQQVGNQVAAYVLTYGPQLLGASGDDGYRFHLNKNQ